MFPYAQLGLYLLGKLESVPPAFRAMTRSICKQAANRESLTEKQKLILLRALLSFKRVNWNAGMDLHELEDLAVSRFGG